jgi:hypothetical protein
MTSAVLCKQWQMTSAVFCKHVVYIWHLRCYVSNDKWHLLCSVSMMFTYDISDCSIVMLREFGILMKLEASTKVVTRDAKVPDTQASFEDTEPIIVIIMIGFLASVFCLLAEIIIFRWRHYLKEQIFSHTVQFSNWNTRNMKLATDFKFVRWCIIDANSSVGGFAEVLRYMLLHLQNRPWRWGQSAISHNQMV